MKYRKLGNTDLDVSLIGLGTMTWGEQNSEAEAHAQLDYAVAHGVNLIDTAEMYPVPPRPETQGATERYIGSWLARPGNRQRVLIATKAAGPSRKLIQARHLRGGNTRQPYTPHGGAHVIRRSKPKSAFSRPYPFHEEDLEREIDDGKFTNY